MKMNYESSSRNPRYHYSMELA